MADEVELLETRGRIDNDPNEKWTVDFDAGEGYQTMVITGENRQHLLDAIAMVEHACREAKKAIDSYQVA